MYRYYTLIIVNKLNNKITVYTVAQLSVDTFDVSFPKRSAHARNKYIP